MATHPKLKIGKNLKKLRTDKQLSQDQLSKKANIHLNTVVVVETRENSNPTIQTLMKIADALGVSINDLIG